ncbi:hypothetical protein ACQ4M4_12880 [Leptolyngbya sp. AN02str]|uniref:hypothetical protein n=1 Tax=Leptolyngbya sp. AN02str TaxID=3423363 RepID=UPI003D31AF7B
MMLVEVSGFDYNRVGDRSSLEQARDRINRLNSTTVRNIIKTGMELLRIKPSLKEEKVYLAWVQAEWGWSRQDVNRFESVGRAFGEHVAICDKFDVSALYELSRPSTPPAIREHAIAAATAGTRIRHARAKAMISGKELPQLIVGKAAVVVDKSSPRFGQSYVVQAVDEADGLVSVKDEHGSRLVPLSDFGAEPEEKPISEHNSKKPSPAEVLSAELDVANLRIEKLEGVLRRLVMAARAGELNDTLLAAAERLI